jgi:hypothetical protein
MKTLIALRRRSQSRLRRRRTPSRLFVKAMSEHLDTSDDEAFELIGPGDERADAAAG